MGDAILITVWALAWFAAIGIGIRVLWWLFQTVVRGTGKAWRGE